jgi:signal transduction histidine kinase
MVEEHDTETEKEFLGIICDESERLTNLISNLLNLSRMESGNIKLEIEEFDIKELTLKCVTLLNELALQRNVKIETDLPMGPLMLRADQGKIEQVIINLISNAVKYNKEDGIVTLALTIINDEAVLVVRDTGLGIPVDSLSRIFEKFYRVDTSLTYEISGTGLGLAIVKHIVESHHGKIIVDSLEGEWTEFTLMLPLEGVESEF